MSIWFKTSSFKKFKESSVKNSISCFQPLVIYSITKLSFLWNINVTEI